MKKILLIIVVLLNLIFTSCNESDETLIEDKCIGENYPVTFDRHVKKLSSTRLFSDEIDNYDFTYNKFNLLAEIDKYTFNDRNERFFNYECNNDLSEKNSIYSNTSIYTYNAENQLIAVNWPDNYYYDYKLIYNGNTISVIGTINTVENVEITLELNASNLITKVIRADNYSSFEYDVNGNLIRAKDFDLNDELLKAYEITYDQNPNPFYGQLSSIYIERFIDYFNTSAWWGIDIFFRYDGFNFPYLINNPLLLKEVECAGCYTNLLERVYTYDSQNYPTKIEESYVGASAIIYDIEYQ